MDGGQVETALAMTQEALALLEALSYMWDSSQHALQLNPRLLQAYDPISTVYLLS